MLVATAPIMPAPEVRKLLSRFEIVVDPKTGVSFTYRSVGDAQLDKGMDTHCHWVWSIFLVPMARFTP